jgi:hypothetical protein
MKKQIFTIILFTIVSLNAVLGQFKLDATGTNDMRLRTSNTDRLNILTNGNVGIGTATPSTKLHIFGVENDGTTATLKISSPGNDMLFDGDEIDVANNGHLYLNNNSTGDVLFANGGGNVGIGGFSPYTKLEVNGDLCLKMKSVQPVISANYIPFDREGKSVVSFDPTANVTSTIYGFYAPAVYGTLLYVINGALGTLVLKHNYNFGGNGFSYNIQTNTLADVTITGRGGALLVYDAGGWRLISYAQ